MKLTYILLVFPLLTVVPLPSTKGEETTTDITTEENETTTEINPDTETPIIELSWGTRGLYGGSYYNYMLDNPDNIHYIHGIYQSPTKDYYGTQNYHSDEETSLDYYLAFGISKMTNTDFKYEDFHHYYHQLNRNITENETIRMDHIIACHPNATFLCPENTETVCLLNGTIYCMSKISVVVPCIDGSTVTCVNSTVPCIVNCDLNNLEEVSLPCLANVTVVDIYEDNKGMTISKVGGTFILISAIKLEDRIFCVTVIVDPPPPES